MTYGTYHYTISNNKIIGVHGNALRELAFEFAAKQRNAGIACEVFTRTGERACVGEPLPREGGSTIATKRGNIIARSRRINLVDGFGSFEVRL